MGSADALLTFGPMMKDEVLRGADKLRWVQALGTGVDNLIDLPSLRPDVMITNIRGIHGAPVSEAAIDDDAGARRATSPRACATRTGRSGRAGRRDCWTARRSAFSGWD